jgi:hypothetical protein
VIDIFLLLPAQYLSAGEGMGRFLAEAYILLKTAEVPRNPGHRASMSKCNFIFQSFPYVCLYLTLEYLCMLCVSSAQWSSWLSVTPIAIQHSPHHHTSPHFHLTSLHFTSLHFTSLHFTLWQRSLCVLSVCREGMAGQGRAGCDLGACAG